MISMFADCSSLKSLDLSSFNINEYNDMRDMFLDCTSLEEKNIKFKDYKILYKIKHYIKYKNNIR